MAMSEWSNYTFVEPTAPLAGDGSMMTIQNDDTEVRSVLVVNNEDVELHYVAQSNSRWTPTGGHGSA